MFLVGLLSVRLCSHTLLHFSFSLYFSFSYLNFVPLFCYEFLDPYLILLNLVFIFLPLYLQTFVVSTCEEKNVFQILNVFLDQQLVGSYCCTFFFKPHSWLHFVLPVPVLFSWGFLFVCLIYSKLYFICVIASWSLFWSELRKSKRCSVQWKKLFEFWIVLIAATLLYFWGISSFWSLWRLHCIINC